MNSPRHERHLSAFRSTIYTKQKINIPLHYMCMFQFLLIRTYLLRSGFRQMRKRYRRHTKDKSRTICPTNAKTRTISQQKTKLGTFSNKSHDSNHLSNNIVYRKLLNQRHSIKTLQMVSKILHMFVVACTTFPKHQLSPLNQVVDNRIQF